MRMHAFCLGLGLALSACANQADSRPVGPVDRALAEAEGTRVLATLELEGPTQRVGGGMAMVFAADGDADDSLDPVWFYGVDPTYLALDVYADVDHEAHLMSPPLTDEQVGQITSATETGSALDIVVQAPIRTYGADSTAIVRVAIIHAITGEVIPSGELPVTFIPG